MKKTNIFKLLGIIALAAVIGLGIVSCSDEGGDGDGNGDDPFDQLTPAERWDGWADQSSTATIEILVDDDGVCTVTVGGTVTDHWKVHAAYAYTPKAKKTYEYKFEAWTAEGAGERELPVTYYYNEQNGDYLNEAHNINENRSEYTIYGISIPKSGTQYITFECASQPGTFYVKIISIKEYSDDDVSPTKVFLPQDGYLHSTHNYRIYCTLIRNGNQLPNAGVFTLQESTDDWLTWGDEIEGTYTFTFNTNTGKIGEISFVSNGGGFTFTAALSDNGRSLSVYGITGEKEYLNGIWNSWHWE